MRMTGSRSIADPHVRQVELVVTGDFPLGTTEARIDVRTNDADYPVLPIPVTVVREFPVRAYPDELRISRTALLAGVVQRQIFLRHANGQGIKISEVSCDNPNVRFHFQRETLPRPTIDVVLPSGGGLDADAGIRICLSKPETMQLEVPLRPE